MKDANSATSKASIGSVCTVIAGQSPKASFYNDARNGLPFYQGKKEFTDRYLGSPTTWTTSVTKKAEAGDILMSVRAPVGPINEATEAICIGRGLAAIRPGDRVNRDYLWYALLWLQPEIKGNAGAVFESINKAGIEKLEIPLPALEEQRRIVAVLDEAFEGLARARVQAEANLQNARELLALTFEHELLKHREDSIQTTIGEVCTGFEYGTSAKSQPKGKMPVLRMGNLQSGEVDWSDLVYTDSDADIEKLTLNNGDVLFNRTNSLEHVGKTAIYRGDMPAIFAGYLIRVHYNKSKMLPEFLNMFLNSKSARDYGRSISGKSVNQANISASKLKTYPIMLPSVRAQEDIVRKMASLRGPLKDLEGIYEVNLHDIDDLRQSVLQKAFAGKLT